MYILLEKTYNYLLNMIKNDRFLTFYFLFIIIFITILYLTYNKSKTKIKEYEYQYDESPQDFDYDDYEFRLDDNDKITLDIINFNNENISKIKKDKETLKQINNKILKILDNDFNNPNWLSKILDSNLDDTYKKSFIINNKKKILQTKDTELNEEHIKQVKKILDKNTNDSLWIDKVLSSNLKDEYKKILIYQKP